jgi:hypothetical protein
MGYCNKYLYSILLTLILMGLPFVGLCQTGTLEVQQKDTDSTNKLTVKKCSLFGGAGWGNNLIYLGSTISHDLPYYSAIVTLGLKNGLNISTSASHLSITYPFVAFYSLSARYAHTVNSWFDYSADISGFLTPRSLQESLFSNFALLNLTTGFDWRLIYTKFTFSDMYSRGNGVYLQIKNSHYFETGRFFKGKAFLSFDPDINMLFGRLVKVESSTGVSRLGNAPLFVQLKKKHNTTTTTYTYSYFFGMMDTEFSLPVTLNFTNFILEAEPSYILPAYSNPDYPSPKGFSVTMSAYFRIL